MNGVGSGDKDKEKVFCGLMICDLIIISYFLSLNPLKSPVINEKKIIKEISIENHSVGIKGVIGILQVTGYLCQYYWDFFILVLF